jgi:Domain of unknown function (DUF4041)/T5orf172 domain
MTFLLFLLSTGLGIALALVVKELKASKKSHTEIRQRLESSDQRLNEADRKYGGLISQEDIANELTQKIAELTDRLQELDRKSGIEEREYTNKISSLQFRLKGLEEQEITEAFGFYESKYDFQEAVEYKQRLDAIRSKQKQLIKDKKAAVCGTEWSVGGSVKEGKKMTDNFIKLALRAFNGECDAAVMKVKYNNIQTMESRINKCYKDLNKLSTTTHCEITPNFLGLKLKELYLTHEFQEKKQEEQEEQRVIREQMREDEKVLREIEKEQQDAERKERQDRETLEKVRREIAAATGKEREQLNEQIEELQKRLLETEANNKQRAISQAQLTKSGKVYIISNIGSFGENIYKIGMTRRKLPEDRVKELGDASVPFPFDIHAMISCQDAPAFESHLHKYFSTRRVNKANERKEFFRVTLEEITKAVAEIDHELGICTSKVTYTQVAEAAEYRKTLAKERDLEDKKVAIPV